MVKMLSQRDAEFADMFEALLDREGAIEQNVETVVKDIISDIRDRGDSALIEMTERFDGVRVSCGDELELSAEVMAEALSNLDSTLLAALQSAADRIRDYHEHEVLESWQYQQPDGTILGQKITALDRVGVYVPGGKASYPSSVLMTVIPAKVAGVKEIIMVVPTPQGELNQMVLAAAALAGVDRVFRIGGAQAVAALAYGTQTIPAVDKIVGPGNLYVATAKKQVFGKVGIDMVAGPSEVVVICDEKANPDWVAMDMFAQAEHDELAQSIVITPSEKMAEQVRESVETLLPDMPRRAIIEQSLSQRGAIICVDSPESAIELANRIAPEHLELMVENPERFKADIRHAGAIFAGYYSAESLGDYCAGPSHVLPTAGTARFSSPLGVYDYQKRSSLIQASQRGADKMAEVASVLARCEGLTAHARSAEYRRTDSLGKTNCK